MNVLFLCTGNACRGRTAEGFARRRAPVGTRVYSAGMAPVGVETWGIPRRIHWPLEDPASVGGDEGEVLRCSDGSAARSRPASSTSGR